MNRLWGELYQEACPLTSSIFQAFLLKISPIVVLPSTRFFSTLVNVPRIYDNVSSDSASSSLIVHVLPL